MQKHRIETENRGIKIEIDEESKTRVSQLKDEEKKLRQNYLPEEQNVANIIAKSL
ncbi:MAG: hypothetical protein ACR5K2_03460 [Wolbachia sp.]